MKSQLKLFLDLSSLLSGFERIELVATGLLEQNYQFFITNAIYPLFPGDTEGFWQHMLGDGAKAFTEERVEEIVLDPQLSLIGRNIVRLWLLGTWLPDPNNPFSSFVVSAEAYQEGVLWKAIGSHPPGAKQPGYGSWSFEPQI